MTFQARYRWSFNVKAWSIFQYWFLSQPDFLYLVAPRRPKLIIYQLSHSGETRTSLSIESVESSGTSLAHVPIPEPMAAARGIEWEARPGLSQVLTLKAQNVLYPPAHVAWGREGWFPKVKHKFCHQKGAWMLVGQRCKCPLHLQNPQGRVRIPCFLCFSPTILHKLFQTEESY